MSDRAQHWPGSASFSITWLEVFAEAPLEGNLHLVVHEADRVPDEAKARLAARLRLSETSFVEQPEPGARSQGADYRHRIFTVAGEIPFAGHPSLGTAAAVARARREDSARLVQQTGAGLQELRVELSPGVEGTVEMVQNAPEELARPEGAPFLRALGLGPTDAHPGLSPVVISTGLPTLVLPVRDTFALRRIQTGEVDLGELARQLQAASSGTLTCYVVAQIDRVEWNARCFTDQVAGGEDAATGSAAGPLAAFAHRELGLERVAVTQGVEVGSRSRLYGRVAGEAVVVSGSVRTIGAGTIELPVRER